MDPFQYFVRSAVSKIVNQFEVPLFIFYVPLCYSQITWEGFCGGDVLRHVVHDGQLNAAHNSPAYKRFGIALQSTIESIYC